MKYIIIFIVKFYQTTAPQKVREACLYEPTCSNYMIQAVEKYGAIKGFIMGIKRIMRCKPPNSGFDYP